MGAIKKIIGGFFLSFGCLIVGSAVPYYLCVRRDIAELAGSLMVIALISYLFIYFGWEWVKREPPHSNKIFAIPIIIFLVFGFMLGAVQCAFFNGLHSEYEVPEYVPEPIKEVPFPTVVPEGGGETGTQSGTTTYINPTPVSVITTG